jgi:hypothetical protein
MDELLVRLTETVTWMWMMIVGHESKSNWNNSRADNSSVLLIVFVAVGAMIPYDHRHRRNHLGHHRHRQQPPLLPFLVPVMLYYKYHREVVCLLSTKLHELQRVKICVRRVVTAITPPLIALPTRVISNYDLFRTSFNVDIKSL